ncbi:MAG: hypothetical protein JXR68_04055 [Bacteroidales bacterium]|nr:hypothetical protein [Bacteroidales bacterium]
MEAYEFFYAAQKVVFSFDGNKLNYKIALKKGSLDIDKIVFFRKFEYQDYDHFIIRYKDENGKIKNLKSFADKSSQALNPLILRLAEIHPNKDLSNTPVAEARKLMSVGNAAKGGFWGAVVVMVLVLAFIFRGVFKDIGGNMPVIIIGGIVALILIGAFAFVYLQGKNESKDWE